MERDRVLTINPEVLKEVQRYLINVKEPFRHGFTDVDTVDEVVKDRMHFADHIIHAGEYFLCDIKANEMWLVRLDRARNGRYKKVPVAMLVDECDGRWRTFNGYWEVPSVLIVRNDKAMGFRDGVYYEEDARYE